MELLATIELRGDGGTYALASVYSMTDEHGNPSLVVRGIATFGVTSPTGDAMCLRAPDVLLAPGEIAAAREAAWTIADRLHAWAVKTGEIWEENSTAPTTKGRAS